MPDQTQRTTRQIRQAKRKTYAPLAVGILVVVLAVVFNYFLFRQTLPSLALGRYEKSTIIRNGGAAPVQDQPTIPFSEKLMAIIASLTKSLDSRAAEIMGLFSKIDESATGAFPPSQIAVVAVEESSLTRIGSWPWSRRDLARSLNKFKQAKVVGFDILFHEPDRTSLKNYDTLFKAVYGYDTTNRPVEVDPELVDNDLYFGKAISGVNTVLSVFFFSDPIIDGSQEPLVSYSTVEARLPDGAGVPLNRVVFREADDVLMNLDELRITDRGARGEGFMNLFPDPTGTVRSIPLFIRQTGGAARVQRDKSTARDVYPSLPLEMARIGLGADLYIINLTGKQESIKGLAGDQDDGMRYTMESVTLAKNVAGGPGTYEKLLTIPVDELGEMTVSFAPTPNSVQTYPAWEVLAGSHDDEFADKYVFFDVTAAGIGNVRASMLSTGTVPAVYVHANMLSAMLQNKFVHYSFNFDYIWQQVFIVVCGLTVTFAFFYGSYLTSFLAFLGVILFLTAGNYLILFRNGTVAGLTMPMLASLAVLFAQFLMNYLVMGRDRRFIRNAFSLNVSPSILNYLENHPDRMSALAGENRNMTVLFSDIRGFTAFSEQMTAPTLAQFLNEYLTPMSDIVMKNLGTVDKFMGDAIMAFWNAPTDDPDHAKNAARSALAMQAKIDELQTDWTARGFPRLAIGCGINSGPMFAGYMGSEQRKNYTVMGDNVNIASRLEGLNKIYSSGIIISQTTREALGPGFFCRVIDKVRVSGRTGPIVIYQLIGEGIQDESRHEEIAAFERVFALYQQREFQAAEALLQEIKFISSHPIYDMYLDRLAVYSALPPPKDWDGVFTVSRR